MSTNENNKLATLIRKLREYEVEKNRPEQTRIFLKTIAHELELLLGGNYE